MFARLLCPLGALRPHVRGRYASRHASPCSCGYLASGIDDKRWWHDADCAAEVALAALLQEPPDGTRIEFEHCTDVYAMWRDDDSSRRAGYVFGDGGETWCLYGHTVPRSWTQMLAEFGPASLRLAVRLVPHPDDAKKAP